MPADISRQIRFRILSRDRFTCRYCGARAPEVPLEVDHIDPQSHGGVNEDWNLVTACKDCNRGKGAMDLVEFSRDPSTRSALTALIINGDVRGIELVSHVLCCLTDSLGPFMVPPEMREVLTSFALWALELEREYLKDPVDWKAKREKAFWESPQGQAVAAERNAIRLKCAAVETKVN